MIDTDYVARVAKRESAIYARLDPSLPMITRMIMAGDIRQGEDACARLLSGEYDLDRALVMTGSYARMDVLLGALDAARATLDEVLDRLPSTWIGSDPVDTNPRFIDLWRLAFARKQGVVTDEDKILPRNRHIRVWRGQSEDAPLGCAWSLSRDVALRFARGASFRTPIDRPTVISMDVPRGSILAYLTGRGEEEVIIDPRRVDTTTGDEE